jgi:hypothetical protein
MKNVGRAVLAAIAAVALGLFAPRFVRSGASRQHTIATSVLVAAAPQVVWDALERFDSMSGSLPLAIAFGVPEPVRCTLDAEAVGARRVCHFDHGTIEQRVVRWDPPRRMDLTIEHANVSGSGWLEYRTASYTLMEEPGRGTRVTRETTLTSTLRPVWYFATLEQWGVQAEHEYLLGTLAKRVRKEAP